MKEIKIVTGDCGSGKSETVLRAIAAGGLGKHVLIAAPTTRLVWEIQKRLCRLGVMESRLICTDNSKDVVGDVIEALDSPSPQVLVITHATAEELGRRCASNGLVAMTLAKYTVVVDEVPTGMVVTAFSIKDGTQHGWPRYLQEVATDTTGRWLRVNPEHVADLNAFVLEPGNATMPIKHALRAIADGYLAQQAETSSGRQMITVAYPSPLLALVQAAQAFFLVAASAQQSPFVVVAELLLGINSAIAENLQPAPLRSEPKHRSVTIHAAYADRAALNWFMENEEAYKAALCATAMRLPGPFIYATNEDKTAAGKSCRFRTLADEVWANRGHRVPQQSFGLNLYGGFGVHGLSQHQLRQMPEVRDPELYMGGFVAAAWLAVNRLSVGAERLYKGVCVRHLGEGPASDAALAKLCAATEHFMSFEAAYQFIARTRLRDRDDDSPLVFVVIDLPTALYIKRRYLPEAKIGDVGFCMKPKGKRERNAETDWEKIKPHLGAGLSQREIALRAGVSQSKVSRLINRELIASR